MSTSNSTSRKATRSKKSPIQESLPDTPVRRGRGRRWFWLLAFFLVPLVALIAAVPWLLSSNALANRAVRWYLSDLNGSVTVGSVSASWFSPCSVSDIVLADTDGRIVAQIPSASSEKSLLGLILNWRNVGKFHVERPELQIILDEHGSNLEQMFAVWLQREEAPAGEPIDIEAAIWQVEKSLPAGAEIDVNDATVAIQDRSSGEQCLVTRVSLKATSPAGANDKFDIELMAMVTQAGVSGPLAVTVHSAPLAQPQPGLLTSGEMAVRADFVPLGMAQSLARRVVPDTRLSGALQTQWNVQWGLNTQGKPQRTLAGRTLVRELILGGGWLAGDALRLAQLEMPCQIACEAGKLDIQQTGATCDIGQITCDASIAVPDNLAELASPTVVLAALGSGAVNVSGSADLARLAQMLPKVLKTREDVNFTSGQVTWQVRNNSAAGGTAWKAELDASRLVAVCQGREIACEKPLHAVIDAQQNDRGLTIQNVQATADFAEFQGQGTAESFQLSGTCDLARLATEVSKFIALDGLELAGQAVCKVQAGRQANGTFNGTASVQLNQFELASAGGQPWTEEQLTCTASLAGQANGLQIQAVNQAQLQVISAQDQLTIALRQPISPISNAANYPVAVDLTGDAGRWLLRARPFSTPLAGWQAAGLVKAQATASCSTDELKIESSQLSIQPLALQGHGCNVNEDELRAAAVGQYSLQSGRVQLASLMLRSKSLSVDVTQAGLDISHPLTSATGQLVFVGDVARLQNWLSVPGQPLSWQLNGQLKGQLQVQPADGHAAAQLDTTIENLQASAQTGAMWREASVRLTSKATYDAPTDTLTAQQFDLTSSLVELQGQGKITGVESTGKFECRGRANYDLARMIVLLPPNLRSNVTLVGQESRNFAISGSLNPAVASTAEGTPASPADQLAAQAELGWQSANIFGFQFSPGVMKTEMTGGILHVLPVDLPVNQGRIHLEAAAQLVGGPAVVTVPAGITLVDHVAASQQICDRSLMFIVPVLGRATRVDGLFSVAIDSSSVPIANPQAADVAGRLTIHNIEVEPGPLVQELHTLMGKPAAVKLQQESVVQFRMVQGRIYNQNLELVFPEFTVRSYGSVGLDESLALMCELPVPPKWLANNPAAGELSKLKIQLPIGGTVSHPKIDARAIEQQMSQHIGQAAKDVLQNGLEQGLNKLLGR